MGEAFEGDYDRPKAEEKAVCEAYTIALNTPDAFDDADEARGPEEERLRMENDEASAALKSAEDKVATRDVQKAEADLLTEQVSQQRDESSDIKEKALRWSSESTRLTDQVKQAKEALVDLNDAVELAKASAEESQVESKAVTESRKTTEASTVDVAMEAASHAEKALVIAADAEDATGTAHAKEELSARLTSMSTESAARRDVATSALADQQARVDKANAAARTALPERARADATKWKWEHSLSVVGPARDSYGAQIVRVDEAIADAVKAKAVKETRQAAETDSIEKLTAQRDAAVADKEQFSDLDDLRSKMEVGRDIALADKEHCDLDKSTLLVQQTLHDADTAAWAAFQEEAKASMNKSKKGVDEKKGVASKLRAKEASEMKEINEAPRYTIA